MNILPAELWSLIAGQDMQTYSVLVRVIKNLACDTGTWKEYFTVESTEERSQCWRLRGELHRDNDQPALYHADGSIAWYQHGKLHRDNDLPALISHHGRGWYQRGQLHRDNDQPAAIYADGRRSWYQHGELHRENRPAVVEPNGRCYWWQRGVCML